MKNNQATKEPLVNALFPLPSPHLRIAIGLALILWIANTVFIFTKGGLGSLGFSGYIVSLLIIVLFIGIRAAWIGFTASVIATLVAFIFQEIGLIPISIQADTSNYLLQALFFLLSFVLVRFGLKCLENILLAEKSSEDQLKRKATELQIASEIAQEVTAIQEVDRILKQVVDTIQDRFDYYYSAIFLVDEPNKKLVIKAASSEAGRELVNTGFTLEIGKIGIISHVAQTGVPRRSPDVAEDTLHLKNPLLPHTRSEAAVPLKVEGKVIGVLDVQSEKAGAFNDDDIAILQTLADQVSVAIETGRLFESTQRQLRELTVLQAVATEISQANEIDDLIENVTEIIGNAFYPDNFGLYLYDVRKGMITKHKSYKERMPTTDKPYPNTEGIVGKTIREGKAMRVGDVRQEAAYYKVDEETCSELCVPLKAGEQVIGAINTESIHLDSFSEADERLLTTLAGNLATAIQQLRLFQETNRRNAELEAIRQASLRVTSELELKPVLNLILEQSLKLVAADDAHIFLFQDGVLQFGAAMGPNGVWREPFSVPRKDGLTYTVANRGNRIVVEDMEKDPLFSGHIWKGAIAGFPLRVGDQILGVMNMAYLVPHHFTAEELRILELLADQAALAIANAKLYEEAKQKTQALSHALSRLQELDRLKNEFIQNASHELRSPVSIIMGYAELFENGELGSLTVDQQEALAIIARRARGLSKMLDNLLTIMEVEGKNLSREQVDMADLVEMVLVEMRSRFKSAGLELSSRIGIGLSRINGVRHHLRRTIENLLSNAIKFTPEGGKVHVHLWQEEGELRLEVTDTGIGIPADQHERIFQRFYQVDGSPTRKFTGAGLGLALVKEVIEEHNGSIAIKSEPGQGSSFLVRLPVQENNHN